MGISIDFMKRACKVTVLKRLPAIELQHSEWRRFRKGPSDATEQKVRTEKARQSTTQQRSRGTRTLYQILRLPLV